MIKRTIKSDQGLVESWKMLGWGDSRDARVWRA